MLYITHISVVTMSQINKKSDSLMGPTLVVANNLSVTTFWWNIQDGMCYEMETCNSFCITQIKNRLRIILRLLNELWVDFINNTSFNFQIPLTESEKWPGHFISLVSVFGSLSINYLLLSLCLSSPHYRDTVSFFGLSTTYAVLWI